MRRPSSVDLPPELARAAREVAEVLRRAGKRAWLVGGAVRDLALEVEPKDADLASSARPEELEALFPSTYSVGRAFGTVVVHLGTLDVQVTTFRAESAYDDGRRPSQVRFSESLQEDAARRDFTCNALYLDPLDDELADPTHGLVDLEARRLRCVGQPEQRFSEDGLRLLRLARLAAQHGLAVEEHTLAGARASLAALRGVSAERVLAELVHMAEGAAPGRAAGLLFELGLVQRLPGMAGGSTADGLAARQAALQRLEHSTQATFLGVLYHPLGERTEAEALQGLQCLRPPRALATRVAAIVRLEPELGACLEQFELGTPLRSRWIRLVRREEFPETLALWRAWHPRARELGQQRLSAARAKLGPAELWPAALVDSAELLRAGLPRGPRWSELLTAAETAQLDGEFVDLEGARVWLARRVRESRE